jgi:hypothetical protein
MVQPTDADRELLYPPQATEEDHGAPVKKIGRKLLRSVGLDEYAATDDMYR